MSVTIMAAVFAANMPELKTDDGKTVPDSTAKFVLLSLADHASEDGENAYIGVKRICQKTNFSTSTVCNALNALRTSGIIELVGKSKAETNNYTINVSRLQSLKFQPVESPDSSRQNPVILAAEVKPSVNHQNKPLPKGDYIATADRKVDAILAQSAKPEGYWQGREIIPPHLLKYADWWNKRTGQEMKGKVKADYLKEWTAWNNDELPLSALDEAFDYVNGWKSRQGGRVAHPREITKDAVGFAAHPKQEETNPITGGFYG